MFCNLPCGLFPQGIEHVLVTGHGEGPDNNFLTVPVEERLDNREGVTGVVAGGGRGENDGGLPYDPLCLPGQQFRVARSDADRVDSPHHSCPLAAEIM